DGVAAVEQKSVSRFALGSFPGRPIELRQNDACAAIHNVKDGDAVSLSGIVRLENHEIGGELDFASGILRRFVEVGDDLVASVGRIDGEVDFSREPVVGAGRSKRTATGHVAPRSNLHARYFGAREGGQNQDP